MSRLARFFWAFRRAWRFATEKARVHTLTRQIERDYERELERQYQWRVRLSKGV